MVRLTLGVALASLILGACASYDIGITDEGKSVRLLSTPEEYPQCVYLGEVKATSLTGPSNAYQSAWAKIRNDVAYRGGSHLKVDLAEATDLATQIRGAAFRCPMTAAGTIRPVPINLRSRMVVPEET